MTMHLHIGGLVAAGFDPTGKYLLTVTHSGRGVFAVGTWERLARDEALAYPDNGQVAGIGPIAGTLIPVTEMDYKKEELTFNSPDGSLHFKYSCGTLTIMDTHA